MVSTEHIEDPTPNIELSAGKLSQRAGFDVLVIQP